MKRKEFMKITAVIAIAALSMSLVACGSKESGGNENTSPSTSTESTATSSSQEDVDTSKVKEDEVIPLTLEGVDGIVEMGEYEKELYGFDVEDGQLIMVKGWKFDPEVIEVRAGAYRTWVSRDEAVANATAMLGIPDGVIEDNTVNKERFLTQWHVEAGNGNHFTDAATREDGNHWALYVSEPQEDGSCIVIWEYSKNLASEDNPNYEDIATGTRWGYVLGVCLTPVC